MDYATNGDVAERLGQTLYVQLTDDAGSGTADEDRVSEARLAAEGLVNSYLGRRYRVPVDVTAHAEVAAVLRSVVVDVAAYRLHMRRRPVPADVERLHDRALWWLELVATGKAVLPAVMALEGADAEGAALASEGPARMVSRELLEGL